MCLGHLGVNVLDSLVRQFEDGANALVLPFLRLLSSLSPTDWTVRNGARLWSRLEPSSQLVPGSVNRWFLLT